MLLTLGSYLSRYSCIPVFIKSQELIRKAVVELYNSITNKKLLIRKLTLAVCQLDIKPVSINMPDVQMNILYDIDTKEIEFDFNKENNLLSAVAKIKNKYGKNSLLNLASLQEKATAKERNKQIGGHKA